MLGVFCSLDRENTTFNEYLNVFLVELDDQLVEFLYLEYMGTNPKEDDAANKADPINQRWWKLTDACQKPFSDVKDGLWTLMTPVN